jgi:Rad3-related DNA helicase
LLQLHRHDEPRHPRRCDDGRAFHRSRIHSVAAIAPSPLIEANGGAPFRDYSLPEAIIELRQGVGRLIRTKQDKGIVVILDPRVLTKNYGSAFLRALPKCPVEVV